MEDVKSDSSEGFMEGFTVVDTWDNKEEPTNKRKNQKYPSSNFKKKKKNNLKMHHYRYNKDKDDRSSSNSGGTPPSSPPTRNNRSFRSAGTPPLLPSHHHKFKTKLKGDAGETKYDDVQKVNRPRPKNIGAFTNLTYLKKVIPRKSQVAEIDIVRCESKMEFDIEKIENDADEMPRNRQCSTSFDLSTHAMHSNVYKENRRRPNRKSHSPGTVSQLQGDLSPTHRHSKLSRRSISPHQGLHLSGRSSLEWEVDLNSNTSLYKRYSFCQSKSPDRANHKLLVHDHIPEHSPEDRYEDISDTSLEEKPDAFKPEKDPKGFHKQLDQKLKIPLNPKKQKMFNPTSETIPPQMGPNNPRTRYLRPTLHEPNRSNVMFYQNRTINPASEIANTSRMGSINFQGQFLQQSHEPFPPNWKNQMNYQNNMFNPTRMGTIHPQAQFFPPKSHEPLQPNHQNGNFNFVAGMPGPIGSQGPCFQPRPNYPNQIFTPGMGNAPPQQFPRPQNNFFQPGPSFQNQVNMSGPQPPGFQNNFVQSVPNHQNRVDMAGPQPTGFQNSFGQTVSNNQTQVDMSGPQPPGFQNSFGQSVPNHQNQVNILGPQPSGFQNNFGQSGPNFYQPVGFNNQFNQGYPSMPRPNGPQNPYGPPLGFNNQNQMNMSGIASAQRLPEPPNNTFLPSQMADPTKQAVSVSLNQPKVLSPEPNPAQGGLKVKSLASLKQKPESSNLIQIKLLGKLEWSSQDVDSTALQREEDRKAVNKFVAEELRSLSGYSSISTKYEGAADANTTGRFGHFPSQVGTLSTDPQQTRTISYVTTDQMFFEDYAEDYYPRVPSPKSKQHSQTLTDQLLTPMEIKQEPDIEEVIVLPSIPSPKLLTPMEIQELRKVTPPPPNINDLMRKPELVNTNPGFAKWNTKVAKQPILIHFQTDFSKRREVQANFKSSHTEIIIDTAVPVDDNKVVVENDNLCPPPPPVLTSEVLLPPPPPIISDDPSYKSKHRRRRRKK